MYTSTPQQIREGDELGIDVRLMARGEADLAIEMAVKKKGFMEAIEICKQRNLRVGQQVRYVQGSIVIPNRGFFLFKGKIGKIKSFASLPGKGGKVVLFLYSLKGKNRKREKWQAAWVHPNDLE